MESSDLTAYFGRDISLIGIYRPEMQLSGPLASGGSELSQLIPPAVLIPDVDGGSSPLGTLFRLAVHGTGTWEWLLTFSSRPWVSHTFLAAQVGQNILQFVVLPFRLSIAPQLFMEMTKAMTQTLSQLGVKVLPYLSNRLI